jgi:hypothetical protein
MSSLTDLTREQISKQRDLHVHTGSVHAVDLDGIHVVVEGETPSGPFTYLSVGLATPGDPCVVLDTVEGDRFVIVFST